MKFIVQYNMIAERQLQKIKSAIGEYPHEYVGVIPFSHEITSDAPLEGVDYLPYGSTALTKIADEKKWKGNYFDLSKFNYRQALKHRDDMLNDNIMTVSEAIEFMKKHPSGLSWFMRPSEDNKKFDGMVMETEEALGWLLTAVAIGSSQSDKIDADMEILVSAPRKIQAEWRWFIIGGKVVSGSMYQFKGQLQQKEEKDEKVIAEAQLFADKWLPNPTCVMDLALVHGKLKVIEFNCLNSSGFYAHDVDAIFKALWENANQSTHA